MQLIMYTLIISKREIYPDAPMMENLQKLLKYICKNGFEHHVAMVRSNVVDVLQDAVENYLGWDLYLHE